MHERYRDITDRIAEPPSWFDENGVPRYGSFAPNYTANIYVREAALVEISCQCCSTLFKVAVTDAFTGPTHSLSDAIRLGGVEYGDPPNMDCCDAGATMSSQAETVLEYWSKDSEVGFEWVRDARFEGPLPSESLEAVDPVPDVLAALEGGASKALVLCTSHRNRLDVVRRLTTVMADRGRALLVQDDRHQWLSPHAFDGLLPRNRVGHVDPFGCDTGRDVTIVGFDQLEKARIEGMASIVVMSGSSRWPERTAAARHSLGRLAAESAGAPWIELALTHSGRLIESQDAVIDAWRTSPWRGHPSP